MAYNEFTLDGMIRLFGLRVVSQPDAFVEAASVTLSSLLRETLAEAVPLALEVSTEKARSEFIIAPVLAEVRRQLGDRLASFLELTSRLTPRQGCAGSVISCLVYRLCSFPCRLPWLPS